MTRRKVAGTITSVATHCERGRYGRGKRGVEGGWRGEHEKLAVEGRRGGRPAREGQKEVNDSQARHKTVQREPSERADTVSSQSRVECMPVDKVTVQQKKVTPDLRPQCSEIWIKPDSKFPASFVPVNLCGKQSRVDNV